MVKTTCPYCGEKVHSLPKHWAKLPACQQATCQTNLANGLASAKPKVEVAPDPYADFPCYDEDLNDHEEEEGEWQGDVESSMKNYAQVENCTYVVTEHEIQQSQLYTVNDYAHAELLQFLHSCNAPLTTNVTCLLLHI